MSAGQSEGRQGLGTLKRGAMPAIIKRGLPAPPAQNKIVEEEENKTTEQVEDEENKITEQVEEDNKEEEKLEMRIKHQESVDVFEDSLEDLPPPEAIESMRSKDHFRFSLLPPVPDDFETILAPVDEVQETIIEEPEDEQMNLNDLQDNKDADDLTNPFEEDDEGGEAVGEYNREVSVEFDINNLPPPPPPPSQN